MKTSLSTLEMRLYIAAWGAGVAASAYHYYIGQEELLATNITTHQLPGLTEGWNVLQRLKDNSDADWSSWKHYVHISWLPLVIHFMVSEVLRNSFIHWIPSWYILFTALFITIRFKFAQTLLLFSQPMVYASVIYFTKQKVWIWVTSLLLVGLLNYVKKDVLFWYLFEQDLDMKDLSLVLISLSWIQVRCMSFSFDHIDRLSEKGVKKNHIYEASETCEKIYIQRVNKKTELEPIAERNKISEEIQLNRNNDSYFGNLADIMSYSLYFPALFMGPLLLHLDFEKSLSKLEQCLSTRLKKFSKEITIFLAEACLLELILHYLYFMAMKQDVRLVRMLRNSGLCGAGLFMGVQFYLKYLIMYGASGSLFALHGAQPPPAPRCILRVHRYSHMWQHFDVGLYRFLVKYMYKPTLTALSTGGHATAHRKLLAAAVTFVFIFLWHGTTLNILLWASLNFAGVAMETLGTTIANTQAYRTLRTIVLKSPQNEERFIAMISTPMLIMSFASNIYFFAGIEVGNVFVERFFSERWYNILLVYFCLHACCHGSTALAGVPSRTDTRKIKK